MPNVVETEPPELRLARYLKELVGCRTTVVRDVSKYEELLWFSDMPQTTDCRSVAWTDGGKLGDAWLEVRKQSFKPVPELPEIVRPWVVDIQDFERASREIPQLRPSIFLPDEEAEIAEGETPPLVERVIADHPEIRAAFDEYRPHWENWSEEHRRRKGIQKVYADLFRLRTQVLKQGEIVEVVLGLGLLDWRNGVPIPVRRHAVVGNVELSFDADKGVIRVKPPEEGVRFKIEDEFLDGDSRPDHRDYDTVKEHLEEADDGVWDEARMHNALHAWALALHPNVQWFPELDPQVPRLNAEGLVVSFAPALILRKRPQTGMLRIYDALIEQISNDSSQVPNGWRGLITDGVFGKSVDKETDASSQEEGRTPSELYFPLPTNREQRRIVETIRSQRSVLVQGPPGTGKSHAIANLICHFLATGQRVLVTAETPQALRVIKNNLPEQLWPLCVSLLGQGGDAFAELNKAVQEITIRQDSYAYVYDDNQTVEIEHELEEVRRRLARADSELQSLRADETIAYSVANGAYHGTPTEIARCVASEKGQYGWLRLPNEANERPPLSSEEMIDWLHILRRYSDEQITETKLRIPSSVDLVASEEFAAAVASESAVESESKEAAAVARNETMRCQVAYSALCALDPELRAAIRHRLCDLEEQRRKLALEPNGWLSAMVRDFLTGQHRRWEIVISSSQERVDEMTDLFDRLENLGVTLPNNRDQRQVFAHAKAALGHLNAGGKWKRFGLFTPRKLRGLEYLKHEALVDGVGASDKKRLQSVCNYLAIEFAREKLRTTWSEVDAQPLPDDPHQAHAVVKDRLSVLQDGRDYADKCSTLSGIMVKASPAIPQPNWLSNDAGQWLELIDAAAVEGRYLQARRAVDATAEALSGLLDLHDAHPVCAALADAVERRDVSAYSERHAEVVSIETLREDQRQREKVEDTLSKTVPYLVQCVASTIENAAWTDRFGAWEKAWQWAIADSWLAKRSDLSYQKNVWQRRGKMEERIRTLLANIAELQAWSRFFARLTENQKAALKGWRGAVQAMGKGTGKSARLARLRREARDYMDKCRDAIPVWVMPRYLVADMVNIQPELYDCVIVDEASQLGIDSAFLFYISKKMVVVGDDQQISPAGIGILDSTIADLQRRWLDTIPHHHAFSPQSSLYDNANIRFGGQNIVLREHFRCMPEIIQFSNGLCYAPRGTPLDPLRTYPASRLPPLVLRHVSDGYRNGCHQNVQNPPEADAIVTQVAACIADSRYAGATMGIISLQGTAQSKLIERRLLDQIDDHEEIEKRRLICGDAYAFQGDERDIIFLSMVAAERDGNGKRQRIGTLADASAHQRFNVAASRARDQLWLFHTTSLDALSDKCMRHRLLSYMLNPKRQPLEEDEQHFDSDFERDVVRCITERNFHVRTQVGVGDTTGHRYRIDLVVEGMQGRLAVECDGDRWHGPERYESDMARQRDLERAGWQFVRIRGGDFYRDRSKALEPVWAELDRLGIKAGGIDQAAAEPPLPIEPAVSRSPGIFRSDKTERNNLQTATDEISEFGQQDRTSAEDIDVSTDIRPVEPKVSGTVLERAHQTEPTAPVTVSATVSTQEATFGLLRAPYTPFEGVAGPDPRSTDYDQVTQGLIRIIQTEGPMLVKRAYDIYLRGCGIARMGGKLKRALDRSLLKSIRQELVVQEDESGTSDLVDGIVRLRSVTPVVVRERGPRSFNEIPPSELQLVARRLLENDPSGLERGSDAHLKQILAFFDLQRLRTGVGLRLLKILKRHYSYVEEMLDADDDERSDTVIVDFSVAAEKRNR